MKNIKDITISIFAIIGFAFLLSSFTTNETEETTQQVYGTPESHVWEMYMSQGTDSYAFSLNKVTGEVRKYNTYYKGIEGKGDKNFNIYRVTEAK
tara:strand:+ start:160 stop:444 length:285 start_codon:yes stop_codon:yes gene_type:complete